MCVHEWTPALQEPAAAAVRLFGQLTFSTQLTLARSILQEALAL